METALKRISRKGFERNWGLKFDFIIIHESDMNGLYNITYKDIADMWIHESFTNYSESLLWNIIMGKSWFEYVRGIRKNIIQNK
jgi:hypothetical protein